MHFEPGDLLFFYGSGWQSRIIELGTWGPSHVGMIIDYHSEPMLIESTTLCDLPCAIRKKYIKGVQAHIPQDRIRTYAGEVWHCAIEERERLDNYQRDLLTKIVYKYFLGEPYDVRGAIESARPWMRLLCPYPDMGSLFCSAFCCYLLQRLGKFNRANPKGYSPARLMRTVLKNATHKPLVRIE